jgi:acyl-coenzyme A synthetase/AMP-(fatty) acid ligase
VEEALHAHPAIAAASVVGIPDALFGENICAVVQLKPGKTAEEEEVRTFVSERVGKFKAQVQVLFWTELPRNFAGKIWKRAIRAKIDEMKAASASA